jgi:hypothetical protein
MTRRVPTTCRNELPNIVPCPIPTGHHLVIRPKTAH